MAEHATITANGHALSVSSADDLLALTDPGHAQPVTRGPLCNCGCGERLPAGSTRNYKRNHKPNGKPVNQRRPVSNAANSPAGKPVNRPVIRAVTYAVSKPDHVRIAVTAIPLILVNLVAMTGQLAWARQHLTSWGKPGQILFAIALESIAVTVGYHAYLAELANDSAMRLRVASIFTGVIAGLINYSHWAGPHWAPTGPAVAVGLMSVRLVRGCGGCTRGACPVNAWPLTG